MEKDKYTWRTVPNFPNYEISIDTKEGLCRNKKTGRILSNNGTKKEGRIYWHLHSQYRDQALQAARWILIENEYFDGAEIDHKDTIVRNNQPSNLHWVDRFGQLNNPLTREHNSRAKKGKYIGLFVNREDQSKPVEQYTLDNEFIAYYPSTMEAERQTKIDHSHIGKCCQGKAKTAGNKDGRYIWRYAV